MKNRYIYGLHIIMLVLSVFSVKESLSQDYIMSNSSVSTCSGTFFDPGGSSANYGDDQDYVMTFCPSNPGDVVRVVFTSFDLEANSTCDWDYLSIYDGPNTNSLIGTFCGTTSPGIVTAGVSSGCLTFVFHSDNSTNEAGWVANVSCLTPQPFVPECSVNGVANDYSICQGEQVNLSATGQIASVALKTDFNTGDAGLGWLITTTATYSNPPCASPSLDGTTFLWMGSSSQHPRFLLSDDFDVSNCGTISFDLKYSVQSEASPCEGPDLSEEGVSLQYSVDEGAGWNDIAYFHPNGTILVANPGAGGASASGSTNFTSWANYSFNIPPGACTSNTRFRWAQLGSSGAAYDNWGLDNIIITTPSSYNIYWQHNPGGGATPPVVSPSATTTYTAIITDGTHSCSDQVVVNVNPSPVISIDPQQSSICNGNNKILTVSSDALNTTYLWNTGSSANPYTVSPASNATYTVTATANGCSSQTSAQVNVSSAPTATISGGGNICSGSNANMTINCTGSSPWQITYTTNGGNSQNITVNTSPYTLTLQPAVNSTYLLTAVTDAACSGTVSGSASFNVRPIPTAVISGSTSICGGQAADLNIACTGTGPWNVTYLTNGLNPQNFTVNSSPYTLQVAPSQNSVYTLSAVSDQNCNGTVSGSANISIGSSNSAQLSGSTQICSGQSATLIINCTGTGPWNLSYDQNGTNIQSITINSSPYNLTVSPLQTTTYTITSFDDGVCSGSHSGSATVTVNAAPTATISGSASICSGKSTDLDIDLTGTGPWSITYTQNDANPTTFSTSSNPHVLNVSPIQNTVYRVTSVQDALCAGTGNGQANIQLYQVAASLDNVINPLCNKDATGEASVLASGGVSPYSYEWNTIPPQTTADASGLSANVLYVVTVTDKDGCSASVSITLSQPAAISVNASTINPRCFGNSDGSISVAASGGSGQFHYDWSHSATYHGNNPQNLMAGSYLLTITDDNACDTSLAYYLTDPAGIQTTITPTNILCYGGSNGSASVVAQNGVGNYQYLWDTNPVQSSSQAQNLSADIIYHVSVTDANSCLVVDSVMLSQPSQLTVDITGNNLNCHGDRSGSAIAYPLGGIPAYSFDWNTNPPLHTTSVSGLSAGIAYVVTVTDRNGCSATESVILNEPDSLIVSINNDTTLCAGTNLSIQSMVSGGTVPYIYSWNTGINLPNYHKVISTDETFILSVTDSKGCPEVVKTFNANVYDPVQISITPNHILNLCEGESQIIDVLISGGNGGPYAYTWNNNLGNTVPPLSIAPSQSITYLLTVTDGCGSTDKDTLKTEIHPKPQPNFSLENNKGCPPLLVQFQDQSNENNATYKWNFGDGSSVISGSSTSVSHNYNQPGFFDVRLTVTNEFNCSDSIILLDTVHVLPKPTANFTYSPQGETGLLGNVFYFFDASGNALKWSWDFDDDPLHVSDTSTQKNPEYSFTNDGIHNVLLVVENSIGCVDSVLHQVVLKKDFVLYIPNAFTPNGDDNNNTFEPKGFGIDENRFSMRIFDRWGELVYETTDINQGWDGHVKGKSGPAVVGVYNYVITVFSLDGNRFVYRGFVALVR